MPHLPPAGWYQCPRLSDTTRYWDGDEWTDQIAPHGARPRLPINEPLKVSVSTPKAGASPPYDAERRLLDYARAATYLGVSARTMHMLGGPGGEVPRVELGSRILFDKVDLDRWVDRLKHS